MLFKIGVQGTAREEGNRVRAGRKDTGTSLHVVSNMLHHRVVLGNGHIHTGPSTECCPHSVSNATTTAVKVARTRELQSGETVYKLRFLKGGLLTPTHPFLYGSLRRAGGEALKWIELQVLGPCQT